MKINSISGLVYRVKDLDKTVEFYETLGFRIGKRDDDEATCYVNWFWVRFVTDTESDATVNDAAPTLYLKVENIDDFHGEVLANGFTPLTEPQKLRTGQREFLMNDPDGNRIAFFAKK